MVLIIVIHILLHLFLSLYRFPLPPNFPLLNHIRQKSRSQAMANQRPLYEFVGEVPPDLLCGICLVSVCVCVIFYLTIHTLLGWLDNGPCPVIDPVYISLPNLRECTNVADVWFWGNEQTFQIRIISYYVHNISVTIAVI